MDDRKSAKSLCIFLFAWIFNVAFSKQKYLRFSRKCDLRTYDDINSKRLVRGMHRIGSISVNFNEYWSISVDIGGSMYKSATRLKYVLIFLATNIVTPFYWWVFELKQQQSKATKLWRR